MNILVTGFQNFMGIENPTQKIAKALNGKEFFGVKVTGISIPVSWQNTWKTIEEHIDGNSEKYDVVINFGVDTSAIGINLEQTAKNFMNGQTPDADEKRAKVDKIYVGAPDELNSTLPIQFLMSETEAIEGEEIKILEDTPAGQMLNTSISTDAGSYLCNHTFYNNMYQYARVSQYKGFIHVTNVGNGITLDDLKQSCAYIIKQIARKLTLKEELADNKPFFESEKNIMASRSINPKEMTRLIN